MKMSIHSLEDVAAKRGGEAILRRLRWIENRIHWVGHFRPRDLSTRFAISPQQASTDINHYLDLAPGNMHLNHESKLYCRTDAYSPLFPKDVGSWVHEARSETGADILPSEQMLDSWRGIDADLVRTLHRAFATHTTVRVHFTIPGKPEPLSLALCPHHLVETADSAFVRGWNHVSGSFGDYALCRLTAAEFDHDYAWVGDTSDVDWHTRVKLEAVPSEHHAEQAADILHGLGLPVTGGTIIIRQSMIPYFARQLQPAADTGATEVVRLVRHADPN